LEENDILGKIDKFLGKKYEKYVFDGYG